MIKTRMFNNMPPVPTARLVVAAALAATSMAVVAADEAEDGAFKVDGSIRQEMSWNTKDWADTPNYNDKGKLSMARTTARVNMDWKATPDLSIVAKFRASAEVKTNFLKRLEQGFCPGNPPGCGATGANAYDGPNKIMDMYNDVDARELYIDYKLNDRVKLRFGKQQIVWGETDFFAANDLIHGFDYTWRSFLEPANEELRKTNVMLKVNVDMPEAGGAIEAFVRPGWDDKKQIGTELDIFGGRWSSQPYASVDFRNIDPFDYSNSEGDYKKVTGGIRWSGNGQDFNYSVSYLKTFYPSPIMNPSSNEYSFIVGAPPGTFFRPTTLGKATTTGMFGDIIYPIVDVLGFTAAGYSQAADAVFSTEVAFIKDAPYQFNNINGPGGNSVASTIVSPGFDGVKKKNVIAWMLRMDKNLPFVQSVFGAEKPMFTSVQLFGKSIQNYDSDEGLLNSVGWGARTKKHSLLLTGIFALSYDHGRIKPEVVVGTDLTYKGGFIVPSLTVELSKNLKWKTEYDHFWDGGRWRNNGAGGACSGQVNQSNCDNAGLFGYFHNRDQLYTSLTYQF